MLISLLFFSKLTFAQFSDDFSDGDFRLQPTWLGTDSSFIINPQFQLQSQGPNLANQSLYLSTQNAELRNTEWQFYFKLNFNPTNQNYVRIYLASTQADLRNNTDGYYIHIGETGNADTYYLYRQQGNRRFLLIAGKPKPRVNTNEMQAFLRIRCTDSGSWTLESDVEGQGHYNLEGNAQDSTLVSSNFFGVLCRYSTPSRYNQFIFDDFLVRELQPDTLKPRLLQARVLDSVSIELKFSENLDSLLAKEALHFKVNAMHPEAVQLRDAGKTLLLKMPQILESGEYLIEVQDLKDRKGNIIDPQYRALVIFYIRPYQPQPNEVWINEVFANPLGNTHIPAREFVELYNTGDKYMLTGGWIYKDARSQVVLAPDTLKPHGYLILTAKNDAPLFRSYGNTQGLSPWPSLNNDKDSLQLYNASGVLIDALAYTDEWYGDIEKQKGGYSLEKIGPHNLCVGRLSWMASIAAEGATPGKENSVFNYRGDSTRAKLLELSLLQDDLIAIDFSKPINPQSIFQLNAIDLKPAVEIDKLYFDSLNYSRLYLRFKQPIPANAEYRLQVLHLQDCLGQDFHPNYNTLSLFKALKPEPSSVLISEILFNPRPGTVDFVEIYNAANHIIDLKDLALANLNAAGAWQNRQTLTQKSALMPPQTYWVLSTNPQIVATQYYCEHPAQQLQMPRMPPMNIDKGTVLLLSDSILIDQVNYNAQMHHPLLRNQKGVSLERIDLLKSGIDPLNFASAAQQQGFATPTYKNSQSSREAELKVYLKSKTCSPDNDGFEDELELYYELDRPNYLATLQLFSDQGRWLKTLLKNESIGRIGVLRWDGRDRYNQVYPVGLYVLVLELMHPDGSYKKYKFAVAIAAQL